MPLTSGVGYEEGRVGSPVGFVGPLRLAAVAAEEEEEEEDKEEEEEEENTEDTFDHQPLPEEEEEEEEEEEDESFLEEEVAEVGVEGDLSTSFLRRLSNTSWSMAKATSWRGSERYLPVRRPSW